MKNYKIFASLILSLSLFPASAGAQTKRKTISKKRPPVQTKKIETKKAENPLPAPTSAAANSAGYKILVEGASSKVETPFIFAARDAETYALMRSLVEGLPESSGIDFTKTAVVAAFAGTRNTGGYSVTIRKIGDGIGVEILAPPPGAMTAQMITAPFQVALVPLEENQPLLFDAAAWTNRMKNYRITKSDFNSSGGIAGRAKNFGAEGTIGVLSYDDHRTLIFNLTGKGGERQRKLADSASGVMKNGRIEFARLDAGTFAETPRPAMKVSGTITDEKLALNFEPLPTNIADGFAARGLLEAKKVK